MFWAVACATGGSRLSILMLAPFFLGGLALLSRVDIEEGRRRARRKDAGLVAARTT